MADPTRLWYNANGQGVCSAAGRSNHTLLKRSKPWLTAILLPWILHANPDST